MSSLNFLLNPFGNGFMFIVFSCFTTIAIVFCTRKPSSRNRKAGSNTNLSVIDPKLHASISYKYGALDEPSNMEQQSKMQNSQMLTNITQMGTSQTQMATPNNQMSRMGTTQQETSQTQVETAKSMKSKKNLVKESSVYQLVAVDPKGTTLDESYLEIQKDVDDELKYIKETEKERAQRRKFLNAGLSTVSLDTAELQEKEKPENPKS